MDILLVRPPSKYGDNLRGYQLDIPIGLLYVASSLEGYGFKVRIFDARVDFEDKSLLNTFQNRVFDEARWDAIEKRIKRENPSLVGISNQFTAQFESAVKLADIVKKVNKNIVVVVGGPHGTVQPFSFMEATQSIDIVVMGEGERSMVEICEWYMGERRLEDIAGVAFRKNNSVVLNKQRDYITDLDALPLPAYHLLDLSKYFEAEELGFEIRSRYNYPGVERAISMVTSRGCPYNCVFCSVHLHMGKKWRAHSPSMVIDHIKHLVCKYGVKHIHFEDDNLNFDQRRFEEIIDGIIANNLGITWDTPNGVRADKLNDALLYKCKQSGCTYLVIGVESGDPDILSQVIDKKLDLDKVVEVARTCKEIDLDLRAFYIIGFPGEREENIKRTIEFALKLQRELDVFPYIHVAMPYLGTRLYKLCVDKGYLVEPLTRDNYYKLISGEKMIETSDFTLSDLGKWHDIFHMRHKRIIWCTFLMRVFKNPINLIKVFWKFLRNKCHLYKTILRFVEYRGF